MAARVEMLLPAVSATLPASKERYVVSTEVPKLRSCFRAFASFSKSSKVRVADMAGLILTAPNSVYMEAGVREGCDRRVMEAATKESAVTVSENVKISELEFRSRV